LKALERLLAPYSLMKPTTGTIADASVFDETTGLGLNTMFA